MQIDLTPVFVTCIAIGFALAVALAGLGWFAWWLLQHLRWVS